MTYDQFIVFMENKNLEPQTKENGERLKKVKEDDERREYTTIKTHEWKRFSINSIIAGAKKAWDSLKKGFTAEDEKNAKEFEDFIFGTGDFDFYGKLRKYL